MWIRYGIAAIWMHTAAIIGLISYVLSLGYALEWLRVKFLPFCSRVFLKIFGVTVRVEGARPSINQPVIWICNHRSSLDIFVILSLGLPRTRYFLSDFLQKIPAFFVLGRLLRTFWTPAQIYSEQRVHLFQRAAKLLRASGDSVFLTPEGERIDSRFVGKFNKGAFHLAMDLGRPIAPIYVSTPDNVSPGLSWQLRPGTVSVSFLELIMPPEFQADRLPIFVDEVRSVFLLRAAAGA